jgi:hypothetical protein
MCKLKNFIPLNHCVEIYVPSTINVDVPCDNKKFVEQVAEKLTELFGGATATDGLGYWKSQNGLVTEKSTKVFSFVNNEQFNDKNLDKVVRIAEKVKKDMQQEAVTLVVDNVCYFV